MPFAATVYSLLLASSAITTPAIEELTAIRQRELTEEEIAAQIEESRIERIESQFDGRELPQEIEAAAQAETPSGAAPASQTVRETVSEPVYPTEIQPSAVVAEPTAVSPQPVGEAFAKQPSPNRPTAFEKPPSRFPGSLDTAHSHYACRSRSRVRTCRGRKDRAGGNPQDRFERRRRCHGRLCPHPR